MADKSNRFFTETAAMRTLTLSSGRGDVSFKIGLGLVALFAAAEIFSASYYYVMRIGIPRTAAQPSAATEPAVQQAAEKDPKNAQVLAEMAKIYESTQNFDRSNEMWRKVQEIGASAGALYELADAKLKRGAVATPPPAQATPADAATLLGTSEGLPDGSTFGVSEVIATETPDSDAETNLMLRIAVKKRSNTVVDHTKVKIQVFFYDTVDDKDIKLTDADVNYEWLTPNHDWAQANPEVLAVTYVRPKNKALSQEAALSAAAAAVNPNKKGRPIKPVTTDSSEAARRRYLGYIVRIYYNDKLQAVRADPTKLLNLFPPPSTASSP